MTTVAALFVQDGGAYFGLPGVDPWPETRGGGTDSTARIHTPAEFRDLLLGIARSALDSCPK